MKAIKSFSCLLLISITGYAQTFTGTVLDDNSGMPLPYANIGIRGKQIGGVSDKNGRFEIDLSSTLPSDILVFSYVGYTSHQIQVAHIELSKSYTIRLKQEARELQEIVVSSKKEVIELGNHKKSSRHTGWGDFSSSIGRAIGLVIPPVDQYVQVNSVWFHLHACEFDSVLVRINFLTRKGDQVVSLREQSKNIFYTIKQKNGWVEVRIMDDLVLKREEVIVAIEWLEAWAKPRTLEEGGSYFFTISLAKVRGHHYLRQTPEEKIQLNAAEFTPSIYLSCVPVRE
ncbi:MAG: carboxypeptidase-like regulatory domain-containing protein [Cyclobacteriaceae bacterium]|jgi:hypothetical protein|nr:carboxypeptidase-like regulatory domain-containing protein [Cyclobacteriaceae bacterium]